MTGLFKSHLQVIPSSLVFTASVRGVIIIIISEDNYHHYCQRDKTQLICHELIIKSMSICVRWTMSPLFLLLVPSSRAVLATYVYIVTTDCSLIPIHCKPTCNNVFQSAQMEAFANQIIIMSRITTHPRTSVLCPTSHCSGTQIDRECCKSPVAGRTWNWIIISRRAVIIIKRRMKSGIRRKRTLSVAPIESDFSGWVKQFKRKKGFLWRIKMTKLQSNIKVLKLWLWQLFYRDFMGIGDEMKLDYMKM